ncbi:MAG: flagellar biosynthesis protein FlhB, partial [Deltaproteobacteria bacterium]
MADEQEKTEEPTQRKIDKARQEGNVPKSADASGFVALFVAVIASFALLNFIFKNISELFSYYYSFFGKELGEKDLFDIAGVSFKQVLISILPIATLVGVAGALGYIMQFGLIFTSKPLVFDLKKINPIKGAKNLFSMQKLIEGIKITAKVSIAFVVGFWVFLSFLQEMPLVASFNIADQLDWLKTKAIIICVIMLIIFFFFGALDIILVRYHHFKRLRMSKEELKREYKDVEGDPLVKSHIRQMQRKLSQQKMREQIPDSDVTITNPTHYAVTLKFDAEQMSFPMCTAKGVDYMALEIKRISRENDVFIHENPPLARQLYKSVEVGQQLDGNDEVLIKAVLTKQLQYNSYATGGYYSYQLDKRIKGTLG